MIPTWALPPRKDGAVKGLADLKGKIVGVLSGSTGEKWSKENQAAMAFAEVKGYNTQQASPARSREPTASKAW